jgi:NAD(P)-dependent dehydrogenase (short-subunit alcohol dehydrogenase family)
VCAWWGCQEIFLLEPHPNLIKENKKMNNKVVLITGALAGIGRATALAFAKKGAKLVVSGRKAEVGAEFVKELRGFDVEAEFVLADVRKEEDVKSLIEKTIERFGRLDVAVNNAGTEGQPTSITEESIENYTATFDTNVRGVFLCLKHELQVMIPNKSGSIINLSSIVGTKGFPGASIYTASKHAVEGFTKSAALEAASANVRVNAVAPGPVETLMFERFTGNSSEGKDKLISLIPLQRAASPEEVAATILFLASDEAPYITGQIIGIDGGFLA